MMVYLAGVNRPIDTGNTYFNEIKALPIAGAVMAKRKLAERTAIKNSSIYNGTSLKARIEYARWIIDCPNCHNAEFAFDDNLFLCSACNNSDIQGKIRRVKMPVQRVEIESTLSKRPIINRHWYPNETVSDLRKQNLKMGVI